jgi:hypothetical protein
MMRAAGVWGASACARVTHIVLSKRGSLPHHTLATRGNEADAALWRRTFPDFAARARVARHAFMYAASGSDSLFTKPQRANWLAGSVLCWYRIVRIARSCIRARSCRNRRRSSLYCLLYREKGRSLSWTAMHACCASCRWAKLRRRPRTSGDCVRVRALRLCPVPCALWPVPCALWLPLVRRTSVAVCLVSQWRSGHDRRAAYRFFFLPAYACYIFMCRRCGVVFHFKISISLTKEKGKENLCFQIRLARGVAALGRRRAGSGRVSATDS